MTSTAIISLILIIINIIVSYQGLKNSNFFYRYNFEVEKILVYKDYKRIITSGFLHVSWLHLIFNMLALYFFSAGLELYLGSWKFLLLYTASLLCGNLFALFIHRTHSDYSLSGASGAIAGIIFASIALFPERDIILLVLPVPSWLFGILYVLYSIYGIRSKTDNIGHEAHLAGGVAGMLLAILMHPAVLYDNYLPILLILVPSIVFIYMIVKHPASLLVNNLYHIEHSYNYTMEDRYNAGKRTRQEELDALLDKISRKGIGSLSKKERQKLEEYSKATK